MAAKDYIDPKVVGATQRQRHTIIRGIEGINTHCACSIYAGARTCLVTVFEVCNTEAAAVASFSK